jgi:hypothetical protein
VPYREQEIQTDQIVRVGWNLKHNPMSQPLRLVEIAVADWDMPCRPHVDSKTKLYHTRETDHTLLLLTDQADVRNALFLLRGLGERRRLFGTYRMLEGA